MPAVAGLCECMRFFFIHSFGLLILFASFTDFRWPNNRKKKEDCVQVKEMEWRKNNNILHISLRLISISIFNALVSNFFFSLHSFYRLLFFSLFTFTVCMRRCFVWQFITFCSFLVVVSGLNAPCVCLVHFGWMCMRMVYRKKPIRRIPKCIRTFNAFAKVKNWTTAVHTHIGVCVCLVLWCFSSFFFFFSFIAAVLLLSLSWRATCVQYAQCKTIRCEFDFSRTLCVPVIGRQLCVITFDTRCARLVWEVRSLVWFIVYALRRFFYLHTCIQKHTQNFELGT